MKKGGERDEGWVNFYPTKRISLFIIKQRSKYIQHQKKKKKIYTHIQYIHIYII